jgi:hypothetical protein
VNDYKKTFAKNLSLMQDGFENGVAKEIECR